MGNTSFSIYTEIENLKHIKENSELLFKIEEIKNFIIKEKHLYFACKLARELEDRGIDYSELEDMVLTSPQSNYILTLALHLRRPNVPRLQATVIKSRNSNLIAEFACWIRGSDEALLVDLVAELGVPRAAYNIVRYIKNVDIEKFRSILMKSKRSRYLYCLAKKTTDPEQLRLIEAQIIKNRSSYYVRLFAQHIKGADINALNERILKTKNSIEIEKMYKITKSDKLAKILLLL